MKGLKIGFTTCKGRSSAPKKFDLKKNLIYDRKGLFGVSKRHSLRSLYDKIVHTGKAGRLQLFDSKFLNANKNLQNQTKISRLGRTCKLINYP